MSLEAQLRALQGLSNAGRRYSLGPTESPGGSSSSSSGAGAAANVNAQLALLTALDGVGKAAEQQPAKVVRARDVTDGRKVKAKAKAEKDKEEQECAAEAGSHMRRAMSHTHQEAGGARQKGVDVRTQLAESIVECALGPVCPGAVSGVTGLAKETVTADMVIVAGVIQEMQNKRFREALEAMESGVGRARGVNGMVVLSQDFKLSHVAAVCMADGTPLEVFLTAPAAEQFARQERTYGASVVGLEVVLRRFIFPKKGIEGCAAREDFSFIASPVILQRDTASNIVASIVDPRDVGDTTLKLLRAARGKAKYFLFIFAADSHSSNIRG